MTATEAIAILGRDVAANMCDRVLTIELLKQSRLLVPAVRTERRTIHTHDGPDPCTICGTAKPTFPAECVSFLEAFILYGYGMPAVAAIVNDWTEAKMIEERPALVAKYGCDPAPFTAEEKKSL